MATVTFIRADLEKLIGKKLSEKDYRTRVEMMGTPIEALTDAEITLEVFPNRPDLLSAEGFARAVRGFLGIDKGLKNYTVKKSSYEVIIDRSVTDRFGSTDFWGCAAFAVVKGASMSDEAVAEFMQLQDKLTTTIGRRRKKCCIGAYDLRAIKWPVHYKNVGLQHRFVPLGFNDPMTVKECLEKHPRCIEYKHLTQAWKAYPAYIDNTNKTLSLLPFTNAEDSKVKEDTADMFIEVTGNDFKACGEVLNIVVTALADRGAELYEVTALYPKNVGKGGRFVTPYLKPREMPIDIDYVNKLLDLDFKMPEVKRELEKMRFGLLGSKVLVPAYRTDIMHNIDLVEDIAIAHGYEKFEPRIPKIPTIGTPNVLEAFSNHLRTALVGLGFQEVVNFVLSNENKEYTATKRMPEPHIEIWNPKTADYTIARTSLAPSMLSTLAMNASSEMPHKIFEIGLTVQLDAKEETGARNERCVAAAISHSSANFSEIKACVENFLAQLGKKFEIREASDNLFIDGRSAFVYIDGEKVGVMGEVSPDVLENFGIEYPAVLFELEVQKLL